MKTLPLTVAISAFLTALGVLGGDRLSKEVPAIVTSQLVTNVVEGNNQRGCSVCEMISDGYRKGAVPAINHPFHASEPFSEATERWVITNVIKRISVLVVVDGDSLQSQFDKPISSTTNRWRLNSQWEPIKP